MGRWFEGLAPFSLATRTADPILRARYVGRMGGSRIPAIEGIFRVKRGLRRRFRRHFQPFRGGGQGTLVLGEVEGADKGAPWHLILLLMRGANFDHTRSPAPRRWLSYTIYS